MTAALALAQMLGQQLKSLSHHERLSVLQVVLDTAQDVTSNISPQRLTLDPYTDDDRSLATSADIELYLQPSKDHSDPCVRLDLCNPLENTDIIGSVHLERRDGCFSLLINSQHDNALEIRWHDNHDVLKVSYNPHEITLMSW